MLNSKNLSPRQVAAFTAILLSVPISLGLFYFEHSILEVIVFFVIIFFGSFWLINFALQTFIYRKIKLIYKLIYQTKATKREEMYNKYIIPQKSIDEVREDVEKWALDRKKQIEALEQNELYRKEFLQNLSHELKTPIFAIQGYVETLLSGALEDEKVNVKFLESTSRNVTRLAGLVQDLDEISRLESGSQPLNFSSFVIQNLVKDVFENLEPEASLRHVTLQVKKGCEQPLTVYADKEKIRQVCTNLLQNAIKYSGINGLLEASFYNLDDKRVLVEISDDGSGIAEEHLPRIFERFYRTDIARSRKIGGSGLGLSICKHIIEAHGHTIHVRSKLNVGSTFGFTLSVKPNVA